MVLKLMREARLVCKIRRKRFSPYNSFKGYIGEIAKNVINRDFRTTLPWQKKGTDVMEFTQSWWKAYFVPIYDFCTKEIIACSISRCADWKQQKYLLEDL